MALYGNVISQRRSGASRYFLFDPLGSTMRLTDGSQNVTDSYLFKAFGESLLVSGAATNPFRYIGMIGYYWDSDGNRYYLRVRPYDPTIGQFITRDMSAQAEQTKLYTYANNSPTKAVDPSGEQPSILFLPICGVVDTIVQHRNDGSCPEDYVWMYSDNFASRCVRCGGCCLKPDQLCWPDQIFGRDGLPTCSCLRGNTCVIMNEYIPNPAERKKKECDGFYYSFVSGSPPRCIVCYGFCAGAQGCLARLVPQGRGQRDKAECYCAPPDV